MASDWRRQSNRLDASSTSRSKQVPTSSTTMLNGKGFLLEIDNKKDRDRVAVLIRRNGGTVVETFYEELPPFLVISDHSLAIRIEQKRIDLQNEKNLRIMPALLREAVKKKIKIRTVETFLKQLADLSQKLKKSSSATNSTDTRKSRTPLQEAHLKKRTSKDPTTIAPSSSSSKDHRRQSSLAEKAFIRLDVPGRRPDIRPTEKSNFSHFFSGIDAGFSVFQKSEPALIAKREREYKEFLEGKFVPTKKTQFKLEEEETHCHFCDEDVPKMAEHERTDAHRMKVKNQGAITDLERVVMTTRLAIQLSNRKRKNQNLTEINEDDWKKIEQYEYGENATNFTWKQFLLMNVDENLEEKIETNDSVENVGNISDELKMFKNV